MIRAIVASVTAWLTLLGPAQAQPTPVPVDVWAQPDTVVSVDMSPDGQRIAMLMRREAGGNPELLLFDTNDIQGTMRAIPTDTLEPLRVFWANDRHLVATLLVRGEFSGQRYALTRVTSFDVETNEWTPLMRVRGATTRNRADSAQAVSSSGQVVSLLADDPDHVLIAHTEERGSSPNYYRTNVATGRRQLVFRGTARFSGIVYDYLGQARGATEYDAVNNRIVSYARTTGDGEWVEVGALDASNRLRFSMLGFFNPSRPELVTVVADEPGLNTQGVYTIDIRTGARDLIFRSEDYDAVGIIPSPRASDGSRLVGYAYADLEGRKRYFIDEDIGLLYASLEGAFPGEQVTVLRISEDDSTVLFYVTSPRRNGEWFLLRDGAAAQLIARNPAIPSSALSETRLFEYTGRDGRALSGYVTVPEGAGPFPAIAMPHGGPWVRDELAYDEWTQMLANQGYVVFQPNYRGSTELGRDHWISGDNQWGLAMQDDVDDGILALVDAGIADRDRLGFFGWSYGGYSAFAAATRENPIYNCSVAGAGISDLSRIRGGLTGNRFAREFQAPTIGGVSPINEIENLSMPMLVVHGNGDTTVPVDQSRRFVEEAQRRNADIAYVEIEGMGHSPIMVDDVMQFYPPLLDFLGSRCGF